MALEGLRNGMTTANYEIWLSNTALVSCDGSTAILVAPSGFVANWLRDRLSPLIRKELASILGFPVLLEVLAVTELSEPNQTELPQADLSVAPAANGNGAVHRGSRSKRSTPGAAHRSGGPLLERPGTVFDRPT